MQPGACRAVIRYVILLSLIKTVCYGYLSFVDSIGFLSMIIDEVLYARCLKYNICSAWFLDIRILTCSVSSSHTLAWVYVLLHSMLVSFISLSLLNKFQYNLYYSLPYACSTSTAIFRLILSLKDTPEHTLHSRVKDTITHISTIIYSSNFKERLLY